MASRSKGSKKTFSRRRPSAVTRVWRPVTEDAGTGSLLGWVHDGTLGDDGSVGNDDNGPLELVLEQLDDSLSNLAEGLEGAEGDPDEDVLALGAVLLLEDNLLNRVDVDKAEEVLEGLVLLLEVLEGLGDLLLELGDLLVLLLHELLGVEH